MTIISFFLSLFSLLNLSLTSLSWPLPLSLYACNCFPRFSSPFLPCSLFFESIHSPIPSESMVLHPFVVSFPFLLLSFSFFFFLLLYSQSPNKTNQKPFHCFKCKFQPESELNKCLPLYNVTAFISESFKHNRRTFSFYWDTMALWQLLSPCSSPPFSPLDKKKALKYSTSQNFQELSLLLIVMRRRPLTCASWEMREVSQEETLSCSLWVSG